MLKSTTKIYTRCLYGPESPQLAVMFVTIIQVYSPTKTVKIGSQFETY